MEQVKDMTSFRTQSTNEMRERFQGMVQTVWSDTNSFLDGFYGKKTDSDAGNNTAWHCFRAIFPKAGKPSK
jgi:hypothetical protein